MYTCIYISIYTYIYIPPENNTKSMFIFPVANIQITVTCPKILIALK